MKTAAFTRAVMVLVPSAMALVGCVRSQQTEEQMPSFDMAHIELNAEYLSDDGKWLLAFVPSGSKDKRVLVGCNGQWVPGDHVDFIAAAAIESDALGPGVEVFATLDSGGQFPKDTKLFVTVMQPAAKFGKPRPVDKPIALRP